MFKRIIVILLSIVMMLSLASCGVRQNLDQKIEEKVTEGVIKKATGGTADVDLDKGQLTVKGEDGEKVTFGDSKWPEGGAANLIPEFKQGNIVSAINADAACAIMFEQVEEKAFKQYIEDIKVQGFTNDVAEYTSGSTHGFNAHLDDNTMIFVLYDSEGKTLTVNFEISK